MQATANVDTIASTATTVIAGLGDTGLSCVRYLSAQGRRLVVIDSRTHPPALDQLRSEFPEVPVYPGEIPEQLLAAAEDVVVSPGLAPNDPMLQPAIQAGVTVLSDIDLFLGAAKAPVVGITGSNGKSSVTALVGEMAQRQGLNAGVGGNLGPPALDLLDDRRELYIVELSSFQLELTAAGGLAVATVLNVTPDHLDRHGSLQAYHQAKHRIYRHCAKAVVNLEDPLTQPLQSRDMRVLGYRLSAPGPNEFGLRNSDGKVWLCHGAEPLLDSESLAMHGSHNLLNALAALAIGHAAGLSRQAMVEVLTTFIGLPHRCREIAREGDVVYIDDSKATNPAATVAALSGLGAEQNIVLIAGGRNKGADFSVLQQAVAKHCRQVLLIGDAAGELADALGSRVECSAQPTLQAAVNSARAIAQPGDLVLLSPACASFDMFKNYIERGQAFSNLVLEALAEESA